MPKTNKAPKVYGNRTCRNCKGICHEDSWRRNCGERKAYYCSEICLRHAISKEIQKRLKSDGHGFAMEDIFHDDEWNEHRNQFYEPVKVITP